MIEKQLVNAYKANNETSLNYIKFAFHPTSFSKTVENIFHISFLVNNCIASIYLGKYLILYVVKAEFELIAIADSKGRPWIKPLPKNVREINRDNTCALVMSINQDEWKVT